VALSIRNPEVEALARDLASRTGTGITEAILEALKEHKSHLDGEREAKLARIRAILARVDQLPILDNRTPEEILGFNEFGGFD